MKTETKEIYKCDHCKKLYQVKAACIKHEAGCKKNPDYFRPCHSCAVLRMVKETIWVDCGYSFGEEEKQVSVLFCEKMDCFIHPPSVAAKGNAFEMDDKENIEMPKECEFYAQNPIYTENWDNL